METADKNEGSELTAQDREVLTRYLARQEKTARRWRYTRFVTLCFLCVLYFNGFYCVSSAYNDERTPFDEKEYIAKLSSTPIPADVTERHWIVGYVNKVAIIAALERKVQSANLLLAIGGAIMLTVAVIGTILLVNHWNDGERN